jgi:hypothetical protein
VSDNIFASLAAGQTLQVLTFAMILEVTNWSISIDNYARPVEADAVLTKISDALESSDSKSSKSSKNSKQ